MIAEAAITAAIIELLEHGLVAHTIEELTMAVARSTGAKVSTKQVKAALKRNSHRLTYESDHFDLTLKF